MNTPLSLTFLIRETIIGLINEGPKVISESVTLSEGLSYHITKNIPIHKNVYRPGSKNFFDLISEAREAFLSKKIELCEEDQFLIDSDLGKFGKFKGKIVPLDFPLPYHLTEAEYKGRKVTLNKPFRQSGGKSKFAVYVRDPKTKNIKKIQFGAKGMSVGLSDPGRRKSFVARHRCKEKKDKTKAGYWACRVGRYPYLFGSKKYYTWW
jgi:hypothetical protein